MSQGRHLTKTLGVALVAVLGAVGITAAAAQAFTEGHFRINNAEMAKDSSETAEGTVPKGKLEVPGLKFNVACSGATAEGTLYGPKTGGSGKATASGLFSGCVVEGEGEKTCTVFDKFNEATEKFEGEKMLTASGTGEVGLQGTKHYARAASASFTTVYLVGEKCTLPEENAVSGSAAAFLPKALEEKVNQPIADITKAEEEELGVALEYGKEPAFLNVPEEGSVHLTGASKTLTFGSE